MKMKNTVNEITRYNYNQRPNRIKLIKKVDSSIHNSTKFNNSTYNNSSFQSILAHLAKNKNNKLSQNSKLHNQSSIMNSTTILESKNNNNGTFTITSYMNKKVNKNINNNINPSSFCIDENKTKQNKNYLNSSMIRLYQNISIKENQKYKGNITNSFRSNINNKKEEYKRAYSRKRTEKEIQNRINKMSKNSFGKINKLEKKSKNYLNNNINNNQTKVENKLSKIEFNHSLNKVKTLGQLRKKNIDKINKEKKDNRNIIIENKEKNQKIYTNLYDKYYEKFKEKLNKLLINKNYRDDIDKKDKYNHREIKRNKNIIKKHYFQRTLTCRKLENKNANKNNYRDLSNGEILINKLKKRNYDKSGKSIGNINKNYNQSKSKGKKNNISTSTNKKELKEKNKKRSKSVVRLKENINFNNNDIEEKYDIESILYGPVKPSKDEDDPFDDVDSVVKALDFDYIKINSKNIFSIEQNEKYQKYLENFEEIFNKIIDVNNQRKSVNNNEKNDANISNPQSEKTTDSFKKNKINISFIENQN